MFSEYFHQLTKQHGVGREAVSASTDSWPEEWLTIYYKTYPLLPHISLEYDVPRGDARVLDTVAARRSARSFAQEPLSLTEFATLLRYSCGLHESLQEQTDTHDGLARSQHRAQPSGGGRFPIETYVLNFVAGEIPSGVFHYDVRNHRLDVLRKCTFGDHDIEHVFLYPFIKQASCAIVLTAVFHRTQIKYGERGYRYILLEAGHIGQNISLVSSSLGLKSVMMGGSDDAGVEQLLGVDGTTESLVYTAIIGK